MESPISCIFTALLVLYQIDLVTCPASNQLMVDLKLRLVEQCLSSGYQDSQDEEGQKVRSKLLQYMSETMIQCCQVAPGQSKARAKLSNQYHQLKAKFGFKAEVSRNKESFKGVWAFFCFYKVGPLPKLECFIN